MATTVADDVALDASVMDDLNSPEAKALLDTIDKLRSINVGDIISLPQIIVVGDQSSGKSSVLEAISRVPFPVKGDLCTRFATELVLRLSSTSYVNVTIRFAKGSSGDQEPFHREELDLSRLPSLIEEATERMGIRPGSDVGFSRDVLRIEVSGPDVPSLTLVDLPGFYHSSTGEQSLEGIKIVNRLVKSYMAQEQSIILAVLSASTQLASQRILDETREHDPKRLRTLGVITKPNERRTKARSTQPEMRAHLVDIAEEFQRIARNAISGNYGERFFDDLDEKNLRKLCAQLRNLNSAFHHSQDVAPPPVHLQEALEYFQFPKPEPVFEEALKTEMRALAAANQGREFPGSPNTDLAIQMFRRQAKPWWGIAERHLDVVTELSKSFVEQLIEHIIGDDKTTLDAILHSCELKAKLDELLLPYEAVFGMPLVAEFNSTMSVREVERVTERVVDVLQNMGSALAEGLAEGTMDRYDVARTIQKTPSLRDEFGIDQTIDNMETYYEMSRWTFTENVAYLALESCLITRLPDIMTPGRVNRMED
ncbi:interferon-induced GTP-binding protein Mx1 [Verticillium dahliae VdLs.17]|uniref:Interferon-induced GTP-binding protein Mx1 n=1 Tax=Verticillium dahliae (strain VdLs.17 / ATCC MYA-4575 / FGSC 10137) TaxID=498257 RepID=G2XD64_VERDV|nr:interferon-induced GTP-binding protein Mx1 [Verticillium dahliae VdLs.17]EGY16932.1 interferon-induced GTP-binding protein Mx1 [Verticillium dahliae VdLs.17]